MSRRKYTEQEFREAVAASRSIRQAMEHLGRNSAGAAYLSFHNAVKEWGVDTSHFVGQLWAKGRVVGPKRDLQEYLSNTHFIQSHKLKSRLIRDGVFEKRCSTCGITKWCGNEAPLELDHIDGNPKNNELTNLRILCPNCHAQTSNYAGKNKKR